MLYKIIRYFLILSLGKHIESREVTVCSLPNEVQSKDFQALPSGSTDTQMNK